jgi:hypothetical protein
VATKQQLEKQVLELKNKLLNVARLWVGINRSLMTESEWKAMVDATKAIGMYVKLDELDQCQIVFQPLTDEDHKRIRACPTMEIEV